MFFMVLETSCGQLHRVAASRFIITLQRYEKYLKSPNIYATFFAIFCLVLLLLFLDGSDVLVEAEDGAGQEE